MTNSDLTIDGSTCSWTLPPTQGEYLGTYTGTFKFRCFLSPTQQLAASKELREMMGGAAILDGPYKNVDQHEWLIAYALTQLKYRVISSPPFWTQPTQIGELPGSIPDQHIIEMVLDASVRAQQVFKDIITKERDQVLENTIKKAEIMLEERSKEEG